MTDAQFFRWVGYLANPVRRAEIHVESAPDKESAFREEYLKLTGEALTLPGDKTPFYVWPPDKDKWGVQRRVYFNADYKTMPQTPPDFNVVKGRAADRPRINSKILITKLFKYGFVIGDNSTRADIIRQRVPKAHMRNFDTGFNIAQAGDERAQKRQNWTRDETILVLALYCGIPFAKAQSTHPDVIRIAKIIGRTPDAVHMKIGNLGSLDDRLGEQGISGLTNASKQDREVWNKFYQNWDALSEQAYEIEQKMAAKRIGPLAKSEQVEGSETVRMTRQRVNQNFFRKAILALYDETCCITEIDIPEVLVASHIKPWAQCEPDEKLNPRNGLCLNALHDRAFDRGLIALSEDLHVITSKALTKSQNPIVLSWFLDYNGKQIKTPEDFAPSAEFVNWHRKNVFLG